ncbi:DUF3718 domain-containing protein [Catenovulum sp. SM1970]|uniref:DUF3718 domain-containing protein n=1 Tax=Marinifaba aquimaris TaxID=2741323 RepID=UPI001573C831|nr:DUF3718 domain-containing protein [Marinifaba aquimaris]NTS77983.1 DUF3718 domain-containing protein [Marinifaba aquimaris]
MNKLLSTSKTLLLVATAGLFSMNAYAGDRIIYTDAEEQKIRNICKAAKSDKVYKLRKASRNANLSYKEVAYNVVCNGNDIIDFAAQHQSYKTASFLAEQTGDVVIQDLAKRQNK